jgi:hypothetical protein
MKIKNFEKVFNINEEQHQQLTPREEMKIRNSKAVSPP